MGPLSVYLDTSVVIPLFARDPFADRAEEFFRSNSEDLIISNFVSAEFAAVIGIRVRAKLLLESDAGRAFSNFDIWANRSALKVDAESSDIDTAIAILRRVQLTLRAPDALHLAVVQRVGAALVTFDTRMAESARKLGISVAAV